MLIWLGIGGVAAYVLARSRERSWVFEGEPRSGSYAGESFQYELDKTAMKRGVKLRVGVPVPIGVVFRVARESQLSRLLRRAGIGREVATGIAGFDDAFEVQSEDARIGSWLRHSAPARGAINHMFNMRVSALLAHGGRMWAEMWLEKSGSHAEGKAVAIAAMLQRVAAEAPPARTPGEIQRVSVWSRAWLPMLWTYGWTVAAFTASFGGLFSIAQYPSTVNAFSWATQVSLYALMLSPVLIWMAARWMRDSIAARIVLGEFIFVGTAGFVVGAGLLALSGNTQLATAPIQTSQVELLHTEVVRKRGGPDHYVVLSPFAPGATKPAKVRVFTDDYRKIERKGPQVGPKVLEVRWRIGAFGQPIVVEAPSHPPALGL